jgi:hypothetical protein
VYLLQTYDSFFSPLILKNPYLSCGVLILPIAHLQIICRLLNKLLQIGDLEGVVFDFYVLGDLDVSPETATVL